MNTAIKPFLKSSTLCLGKSYAPVREKESSLVDLKFYQKLFIVLASLSAILIFPELPREMENICKAYNSRTICNVW